MEIDPNLITTVQVSELPPNALAPENEFPHQVGDVLSKATIQQLLDYVRAQSISQPYEIKCLRIPNADFTVYLNANFDMTPGATEGLGKVDGLWNGWAIFNGNNGTDNLDGQTLIGWGANYNTIGQFVGESEHTLTIPELPVVSPINGAGIQKGGTFGGTGGISLADTGTGNYAPGQFVQPFGGGEAHNNIQPSMVVLMIYKLP